MDARILWRAMFSLLCAFVISDTASSQRDMPPGNIPIVNPTPGGTTPIVNPIAPPPPNTFTGPTTPTTPTGPTPTTPTGPTPTTPTGPTPTNPTGPTPTNPTGPTPTGPTTSGGSWCIANPSASETALQVALDYACGYGGANCAAVQPSGACYDPNTVRDHASYAFNEYYQKNPGPTSCSFGGTAQISNTDPSHGSCRFASSTSTPRTPPSVPMTPPTIPMTPPSTTTPASPYTLGGNGFGSEPTGNDYGLPPTGSPNSAGTVSINLLLFITMNCLIFSAVVANHF
ncbi:hypothetical protein BUALT_Bualt03G0033100 [Buddleja alternifolia]|uniref:X8 domain-containing protein n=1 Tax=Buddleja alternifolia TaxID=168488 RepID=A0AAV6Y1N4_9LAMI|nr:hypothetical protein BUALT_Bualt03G0033100 [Buddleja alternifolia]